MNRHRWALLGVLLLLPALVGCSLWTPKADRPRQTGITSGEITIGVGWPLNQEPDGLARGVAMAVDEVNRAGGVLGPALHPPVAGGDGHAHL